MAFHPLFPSSPSQPLLPGHRWFPADEAFRDNAYEKLLPPLVAKLRQEIHAWRESEFEGASAPTKARLKQWSEDTTAEENGIRYDFLYVDQDGFEKHGPETIAGLAASFTEYK